MRKMIALFFLVLVFMTACRKETPTSQQPGAETQQQPAAEIPSGEVPDESITGSIAEVDSTSLEYDQLESDLNDLNLEDW